MSKVECLSRPSRHLPTRRRGRCHGALGGAQTGRGAGAKSGGGKPPRCQRSNWDQSHARWPRTPSPMPHLARFLPHIWPGRCLSRPPTLTWCTSPIDGRPGPERCDRLETPPPTQGKKILSIGTVVVHQVINGAAVVQPCKPF